MDYGARFGPCIVASFRAPGQPGRDICGLRRGGPECQLPVDFRPGQSYARCRVRGLKWNF